MFRVMQGNMTAGGCGDYWEVGSFEDFNQACDCFNDVKEDLRGITKHPHGYLETLIIDDDGDDECLASMIYRY